MTTQSPMSLTATAAADLFRREPEGYLDVGAGQVAYRRIGSGPDVLFVHGWPVSGATFRGLLPDLVDHVTCHIIDLPGAGSSKFAESDELTVDQHIRSVRKVLELLDLRDVAVVGHDSGGLIARHAFVGDQRVRAFGLIDTEQPSGLSWRFKLFLAARHAPGFGSALGWIAAKPTLRRHPLVLGGAFADSSLLNGEFDEFFLQPLHRTSSRRVAAQQTLRSFDRRMINELQGIHQRIDVPVRLVWGDQDVFFPLEQARAMVDTFPNADLAVIEGAGLFSHEERPTAVARALLPILVGGKVATQR